VTLTGEPVNQRHGLGDDCAVGIDFSVDPHEQDVLLTPGKNVGRH
jgi:hypothetical protein